MNGGEFVVTDIKKSRLGEVFQFEDGEWWYKATVNLVTIDEEQGKEKKVRTYYLVEADDIQEALKRPRRKPIRYGRSIHCFGDYCEYHCGCLPT